MSSPAVNKEEWAQESEGDKREEILRAMEVSTGEGPGRFLKALREHEGIPELEAASRLNISLSQLHSLEKDEFDMLPAPIYVRNYLRRYSELLNISVDLVVAAYERCGECDEPEIQRVSIKDHITSRHVSMRWATYSVVALIMVLVLVWAQNAGVGELVDRFKTSDADVSAGVATELALPKPPAEVQILEELPAE